MSREKTKIVNEISVAFTVGVIMGLMAGAYLLILIGIGWYDCVAKHDGDERYIVNQLCWDVQPDGEYPLFLYIGYDNYLKADIPPEFIRCKYFNQETLETKYMVVKINEDEPIDLREGVIPGWTR